MAARTLSRILMTADAVGGVWTYAVDLARELAPHGVAVTLAVMGPLPSSAQAAEARAIRGLDLRPAPFSLEWMPSPWVDVARAGSWLLALEQEVRPDVVHLNGYVHAALPWRAPVMVVAHSCVASWWTAVRGEDLPHEWRTYRTAVATGLRSADVVIAPSRAMRAALVHHYGLGEDAQVIPNARRAAPAQSEKEPFVFAAGRLWDEAKNIASLDAAAALIAWPIKVAGDTANPQGHGRLLSRVACLGRLPAAEVRTWMQRAAIYAFPARYEPFGLSVLEAAQSGCALVLGDIASLRENWDGAAVFVPSDDSGGLARAISLLIDDEGFRRRLGAASAERARAFSVERQRDEYLRVYRELAGRGRGHRLAATLVADPATARARVAGRPPRH